jgi:hypothetical protein
MGKTAILILLCLIATPAIAQSDLCWRDPYPWIPGEWAGSGSVIEAGNRFQSVAGATVELWATIQKYDDARQYAIRHQTLPARLLETTRSDVHGAFRLKSLGRGRESQTGYYEIRVYMHGRESGSAYTEIGTGLSPQWMGRGIRAALSHESKGCSRIYSAGLDDTDCGVLDCENLPAGPTKIVFADGPPLIHTRLDFYLHSKMPKKDPEFSLTTDASGMITTLEKERGCFDVAIEGGGSMHLCFRGTPAAGAITVTLPLVEACRLRNGSQCGEGVQ